MVQDELQLQWQTNMKLYNIQRNNPGPKPDLNGMPLFYVETVQDRHSYNGELIRTYTPPTQRCNFE